MTEFRDLHNNVYKVIERTLNPDNEEVKETVLDELFNIFTKNAKA